MYYTQTSIVVKNTHAKALEDFYRENTRVLGDQPSVLDIKFAKRNSPREDGCSKYVLSIEWLHEMAVQEWHDSSAFRALEEKLDAVVPKETILQEKTVGSTVLVDYTQPKRQPRKSFFQERQEEQQQQEEEAQAAGLSH